MRNVALKVAVQEKDLIPLRHILRAESRPEAAIAFENAVRAGNLSAINERPDLRHADGIVTEALGGYRDRWRISSDKLSAPSRAQCCVRCRRN
jgi:hypothetical protein